MRFSRLAAVVGIFATTGSCTMSMAQEPASSKKPFLLEADYAIFRGDAGKRAYLEIAYGIRREALVYVPSGADSVMADLTMRVNIYDGDSLWVADMWRTPHRVAVTDSAHGQRISNVLRFPIHPGTHQVKLFARDLRGAMTRSDSLVMTVKHDAIVKDALALSDIELASSIVPNERNVQDVFSKHSMRVLPNPSAIFGAEQPLLYYYLEIYNLRKNVTGATYRTRWYLTDAVGAPISACKAREQTKPLMESSIEAGALNVSAVPNGVCFLNFELLDSNGKNLRTIQKKVFIYNPQLQAPSEALAQEVPVESFSSLSDNEVAREIAYVKYLYDKAETEIAKKLANPPAKRQFLSQFWSRYSRQKGMAWQELRGSYLRSVSYADANFGRMSMEGWRSDRGRVFLVYGKPDDIERFPFTDENKPYEVWTYNQIEGGVEFIFGDRTGLGEYQLLHSTKLGEVKNESWRELITGGR